MLHARFPTLSSRRAWSAGSASQVGARTPTRSLRETARRAGSSAAAHDGVDSIPTAVDLLVRPGALARSATRWLVGLPHFGGDGRWSLGPLCWVLMLARIPACETVPTAILERITTGGRPGPPPGRAPGSPSPAAPP